ncbi:hypothetical protein [Dissulfurispira sp.]|uniref:hypothetical protein n=1 Tax=Dissulfurispira sp. TaxID=2817609 RepID=UPI002FDA448A
MTTIKSVVGTSHPDYANKTIHSLLDAQYGYKRLSRNLTDYEMNPNYYFSHGRKSDMSFSRINNGEWYITREGNRRTALAKIILFLDGNGSSMLHGVTLSDYMIDLQFMDEFEKLRTFIEENRLPYYVEPKRELIRKESDDNKIIEGFRTNIFFGNMKTREQKIIGQNEIGEVLKDIKRLHQNNWKGMVRRFIKAVIDEFNYLLRGNT